MAGGGPRIGWRKRCGQEHVDEDPGRGTAPGGGEITLDGKPVHFHTPHQARAAGIGIIYQELSIAPNLTVAGNVFLGSEKRRLGFLTDTPGMVRETQQVLDRLGARFKAAHHGHGRANHGLVRPRNGPSF